MHIVECRGHEKCFLLFEVGPNLSNQNKKKQRYTKGDGLITPYVMILTLLPKMPTRKRRLTAIEMDYIRRSSKVLSLERITNELRSLIMAKSTKKLVIR